MARAYASSEEDELLSELFDKLQVESKFKDTQKDFIPDGVLDHAITKGSVTKAMKSGEDDPPGPLVDFVLRQARKGFAITAYGLDDPSPKWLRHAMLLFQECDFNDSYLPIKDPMSSPASDNNPSATTIDNNIFQKVMDLDNPKNKTWKTRKIKKFCKDQWKFLAPVFSTAKSNHDLPAMAILPFIVKHFESDHGSFGQVFKYEIHPDHIVDPLRTGKPSSTVFAVKAIFPGKGNNHAKVATHWASEAKALAKMNTLNQDHIVRFITAFRRYSKDEEHYYLMFEWADGGNLQNLWWEMPRPKLTASLAKATLGQLLGLAEALSAAHYPEDGGVCRHGDLKPANILWFREGGEIGTLKIGDWGEAKVHNIMTELRPNRTTAEYGTRRYEAPEVKTGLNPNFVGQHPMRRSRLYDIWAMGCITLEFLIWLLYGTETLNTFNQRFESSPFYQIKHENGRIVTQIHEIVTQWIDHMALDPACQVGTTALGDLLELVRTGLLVVKLPRRLGRDVSSERSGVSSEQLKANLSSARMDHETLTRTTDDPKALVRTSSDPPTKQIIPAINVIPAAPQDSSTLQERVPVQPEPEGKDTARRFLATELKQRLENIVYSDDEGESYWFTDDPRLPAPGYADESTSVQQATESGYETEPTVQSPLSPTLNKNSQAAGGLPVPKPKKVVGLVSRSAERVR